MAIITKIQQRSGLAVAFVAVAMMLFIVGGDLFSGNSWLLGQSDNSIGSVDGKSIDAQTFALEVERMSNDFQIQNNRTPNEFEMQSLRDQAWNQLIFSNGFKKEFEKLGLTVTEDEKVDMVTGENIHPAIKSSFTNQQTQEFDRNQVIGYLGSIREAVKSKDPNVAQQAAQQLGIWLNFEAKLPDDRLRMKFENLLKGSVYVTSAEGQREYTNQSARANGKYLFVPYYEFPDSAYQPSDAQIAEYFNKNKNKYKAQDQRGIQYVEFKVVPSAEDSAEFKNELLGLKADFAEAGNDTAYAEAKSDKYEGLKSFGPHELPAELKNIAASLKVDSVYGPFILGNEFTLYKVMSVGNDGDYSAKASHILFKADGESEESKKAAKANAEKILKEIKAGASFEEMAKIHGTDGTASQGGDLGWFSSGRMVKKFEDAVFGASSKGVLPTVTETEFGYHLIKITEVKTNMKYKVIPLQRALTASDETKNAYYTKASEFLSQVKSKADFDTLVKKQSLIGNSAMALSKSSMYVNDIPNARNLVAWAFNEAKVGQIANKVFEFDDRYVVALLAKATEEGVADLDDVKDAVKIEVVKALKAKDLIAKLGTASANLEELNKKVNGKGRINDISEAAMNGNSLPDFGYDPQALGRLFGLKDGTVAGPFKAESGVGVLVGGKAAELAEIADYNTYKTQIQQRRSGNVQYSLNEAYKQLAKVKDQRIKFY